MDIGRRFNTKATWKGYQNVKGKKTRVQYLGNVAKVGNDIVDNRDGNLFRDYSVQFAGHFNDKSGSRLITIEEAVEAVCFGIELRSDRYGKERYQYLHNDLLVAGKKLSSKDFEIISAYNIKPAFKRDFLENLRYLKEEMLAAGAYGFNACVMDYNMATARLFLKEGSTDDPIVWRLGDDPIETPDSLRQYLMSIAVDNKDCKISLKQLRVLENWGLIVADHIHTTKYKDGERVDITYNMSRFSGNAHVWARQR